MIILRDFFGPKPKWVKNGSGLVLQQSMEMQGRVMNERLGVKAGVKIDQPESYEGGSTLPQTKKASRLPDGWIVMNWRKQLIPNDFKGWTPGPILNQGAMNACVAFATVGRYNAAPYRNTLGYDDAVRGYAIGNHVERNPPGTDAGLFASTCIPIARQMGLATAAHKLMFLRWSLLYDGEIISAIANWLDRNPKGKVRMGPLFAASLWREGMLYPDNEGFVKWEGKVVGSHAYYLNRCVFTKPRDGYMEFVNSWGREWGAKGVFRMTFDEFRRMLPYSADFIGMQEKT